MLNINEDRAVLLAASNMGAPLDGCRSVAEVKDFIIQGIMEGFCGQDEDSEIFEVVLAGDGYVASSGNPLNVATTGLGNLDQAKWEGRAEAWAFKCWDDEYMAWLEEIKEYDGKPLPDYWADIDSILSNLEDRR